MCFLHPKEKFCSAGGTDIAGLINLINQTDIYVLTVTRAFSTKSSCPWKTFKLAPGPATARCSA